MLRGNAFLKEDVDTILCYANILTLDESNTVIEAIAIKDGKIHALETTDDILREYTTKLGLKSVQRGFDLYKEISGKRWLPRKVKSKISDFLYNKYFFFRE